MQVVLNTTMDNLLEKVPNHLPDIVLLNLLLQCKALLDLQKYMNMYLTMSQVKYYHCKYTMPILFVSVHLFTNILDSLKQQLLQPPLYFVKLNMNSVPTGRKAYQGVVMLFLCLI